MESMFKTTYKFFQDEIYRSLSLIGRGNCEVKKEGEGKNREEKENFLDMFVKGATAITDSHLSLGIHTMDKENSPHLS